MHKHYEYESMLSPVLHGYVQEKRAVGYKFNKGAAELKRLDSVLLEMNFEEVRLSKDLIMMWTAKKKNEKPSTRCGRISIVRGLAKYMIRLGYDAYIYPNATVTIERYSYNPYIYSELEIKRIFEACDNYPQVEISPYRHIMLPLLFRVLYGCGLRISEALNLTYDDVNIEEGTIHIRHTKFGKERKIPMSQSLTKRFIQYLMETKYNNIKNPFIFPSPFGGHYNESTIYKLFRDILWRAGISHTGNGPRLHDFRHTFSVHCLKRWVLQGENLTNLLPYLSVYLGHCDLRGTQHYLRLTADLYPDITKQVEEYCSNIIPEVTFYETD